LHIWFPLLFVLLLLIVAGMGFTLLIGAVRSRGAVRGAFDPRNADWHPLATVGRAGRGQAPETAAGPAAAPPDPPPDPPPAASPAGPSAGAAGMDFADLAASPGPAPVRAQPATTDPPYAPQAPEAPDAPEAPEWA
jgi:hypothetical protein